MNSADDNSRVSPPRSVGSRLGRSAGTPADPARVIFSQIAAEDVARALENLELRIRALEAENAALKRQMTNSHLGQAHDQLY